MKPIKIITEFMSALVRLRVTE